MQLGSTAGLEPGLPGPRLCWEAERAVVRAFHAPRRPKNKEQPWSSSLSRSRAVTVSDGRAWRAGGHLIEDSRSAEAITRWQDGRWRLLRRRPQRPRSSAATNNATGASPSGLVDGESAVVLLLAWPITIIGLAWASRTRSASARVALRSNDSQQHPTGTQHWKQLQLRKRATASPP